MFLGNGVIPQASLVTSKIQQRLYLLKVKHIFEANQMTTKLLKLQPKINFLKPPAIAYVRLVSLSGASHGGGEEIYGQMGTIGGMLAHSVGSDDRIYHPTIWGSHTQRRVSYSLFGAEILAAADVDDHGFDLKLSYRSIFTQRKMRHDIYIDSRGLFETIITIHEPI